MSPALADVWQMLATAFAPPLQLPVREAMLDLLVADLEQALDDAGLARGLEPAALREALAVVATPDGLLREYARVFLPPGALATPNLTRYVDGGPTGPCMDALERAYAHHGLAPSDGLRDLPDHLAHQAAAVAHLLRQVDTSAARACEPCGTGFAVRRAGGAGGPAGRALDGGPVCGFVCPARPGAATRPVARGVAPLPRLWQALRAGEGIGHHGRSPGAGSTAVDAPGSMPRLS